MKKTNILTNYFDAVVMLTWSNWHTELRSNRYHYASRFSRHLPVIFVQPDLVELSYYYETVELNNFYILHLWCQYEQKQYDLLNQALAEKNILQPLIWNYNSYFAEYLENKYFPLRIFHGTEDYFSIDSPMRITENIPLQMFKLTMERTDLLVSVSEGVNESFYKNIGYKNDSIIITNGCDYHFYSKYVTISKIKKNRKNKIVFYQGNIYSKLNYELLDKLAKEMSTWQFWFCGKIVFNELGWQKLCENPNVKYLGLLKVEELRKYFYRSTVGIIPFVEQDWIIERSFPLKSFEYLAAGLPVVTVPIKALFPYSHVFHFARTIDEFKEKIQHAAKERYDKHALDKRLRAAAVQDYDLKFDHLLQKIERRVDVILNNIKEAKHIDISKSLHNQSKLEQKLLQVKDPYSWTIVRNPHAISNRSYSILTFIKQIIPNKWKQLIKSLINNFK
ncbi:glycosyltransferase [Candidatus Tisiphia endosymbiont of Nemotelus uliginosus]|uniref:glycosyltransferase n=1 Tax=Candidatus Tisiphia endosymbiont of Nemotelus uliginosus TaxID=3077926 RepID=UPI0035C9421E